MFDLWYYGRRIGATDAPTIYDERGHEHRALIRRLHHSAPDHEPPRCVRLPETPFESSPATVGQHDGREQRLQRRHRRSRSSVGGCCEYSRQEGR